ncbi:MAG: PaaI family thioesterase [Alphaproteobacteria bacterium]|nr:PaaI family thioesterase [Alphaproteobacteria bacterium]
MTTAPDGGDGPQMPPPPGYLPLAPTSAFGRLVGPLYERQDAGGRSFGFRVAEGHINLGGFAHGGMLASFADIVLGLHEGRDFDRLTVTIRLVVDFIGAAQLGDWVEGRVRISRRTRSLTFVEADITARGRVVMTAQAVFKVLERRRSMADATLA